MGKAYLIENSGASQIFDLTDLKVLEELGSFRNDLDQCMYGAELEGMAIKKHSAFKSNKPMQWLNRRCDHSHEHLQLKGSGPDGSRTASAAKYPVELCNAILDAVNHMQATAKDGGRKMQHEVPGDVQVDDVPGIADMPKIGQVIAFFR